jgi:hypothetical protein
MSPNDVGRSVILLLFKYISVNLINFAISDGIDNKLLDESSKRYKELMSPMDVGIPFS